MEAFATTSNERMDVCSTWVTANTECARLITIATTSNGEANAKLSNHISEIVRPRIFQRNRAAICQINNVRTRATDGNDIADT